MRITVSTLFFYKQELCLKFIAAILPSLDQFVSESSCTLEFVISDNTPSQHSILPQLRDLLDQHSSEKLKFVTQVNEYNLGFGLSHNRVFTSFPSDVFIVLNNDVFIHESVPEQNWIKKLCEPLLNIEECALVGVSSSPSRLSSEGEGRWAVHSDEIPDYAEGSILAVKSNVANEFGLFASDLEIAYFEDSDLALRYRQNGYKLKLVEITHEHVRGSSSSLVDPDLLISVRKKNKIRFLKRWKLYLEKRTFSNRIFLDFTSGGWGDVVAALPTLHGFLRDHPTAMIEIQTNQQGLIGLLALPRVTVLTENFKTVWQVLESKQYDRVFSLGEVDFSSLLHLGRNIADTAGVEYDLHATRKSLENLSKSQSKIISELIAQHKKIAVIHVQSLRSDWEGRSLGSSGIINCLELLKNKNYHLVLIGTENHDSIRGICDADLTGQTSLMDIYDLCKNTTLFFGMDSGPMHFAQLLGVPSFVVFGATLPSSRLSNLSNSYGYVRKELSCIGCYHRHISSPRNYCVRRDEACVQKIVPDRITEELESFLNKFSRNDSVVYEQEVLSARRTLNEHPPVEKYPNLSDARLRQLVKATVKKVLTMLRMRFFGNHGVRILWK